MIMMMSKEKLILYPDPDPHQSQNLIDWWSFAEVYHSKNLVQIRQ